MEAKINNKVDETTKILIEKTKNNKNNYSEIFTDVKDCVRDTVNISNDIMLQKLQAQINLLHQENFELNEKLLSTIENGLE